MAKRSKIPAHQHHTCSSAVRGAPFRKARYPAGVGIDDVLLQRQPHNILATQRGLRTLLQPDLAHQACLHVSTTSHHALRLTALRTLLGTRTMTTAGTQVCTTVHTPPKAVMNSLKAWRRSWHPTRHASMGGNMAGSVQRLGIFHGGAGWYHPPHTQWTFHDRLEVHWRDTAPHRGTDDTSYARKHLEHTLQCSHAFFLV